MIKKYGYQTSDLDKIGSKKWERTKKSAYDIKMAVSIDGTSHEAHSITKKEYDIISAEERLHAEMKLQLGERQYKVYDLLYVQHKDEAEVAKEMGYKTSESGRKAGYRSRPENFFDIG